WPAGDAVGIRAVTTRLRTEAARRPADAGRSWLQATGQASRPRLLAPALRREDFRCEALGLRAQLGDGRLLPAASLASRAEQVKPIDPAVRPDRRSVAGRDVA